LILNREKQGIKNCGIKLTVSRFCGIILLIKNGFNKSVLIVPGRSVVSPQKQATERPFSFLFPFQTFLTAKSGKIKKKYYNHCFKVNYHI